MKKRYGCNPAMLLILVIFLGARATAIAQYNYSLAIPEQNANIQYDLSLLSYNDFYQNLAPYGQWIEDPKYGYVWSPNVDAAFRPYYSNGHWALTGNGNTWISGYAWGWACFHYGRWTFNKYYGWLWIPGQDWGPAWVSWCEGNGFYGWAPLSPGYAPSSKSDYICPNDWWVFLPPKYIYSGSYYRYWSGPRNNKDIIHHATFINNTYENNQVTYVPGPGAKQLEATTKQPAHIYKLSNSNNLNTKTHLDVIKMYRPAIIRSVAVNEQGATPPGVMKAPRPVGIYESITGIDMIRVVF
jgi:hypothetical protein